MPRRGKESVVVKGALAGAVEFIVLILVVCAIIAGAKVLFFAGLMAGYLTNYTSWMG
ncbi:MAG: hypothetical protein ACJATN_002860 [Neolewinella sp.]